MNPRGFTLVELLVVMTIVAVLAVLAVRVLGNLVPDSQLALETESVVTMLRSAQAKTLSGEADDVWGVYLTSSDATVFLGASYAGRDSAYDQLLVFSDTVSASGLAEIVFEERTGKTTNTGTITLSSDVTNESTTITINAQGMISQ
jgi:prepilin-type N-terminal cleavage/methylation domain-containing protein